MCSLNGPCNQLCMSLSNIFYKKQYYPVSRSHSFLIFDNVFENIYCSGIMLGQCTRVPAASIDPIQTVSEIRYMARVAQAGNGNLE